MSNSAYSQEIKNIETGIAGIIIVLIVIFSLDVFMLSRIANMLSRGVLCQN